MLTLMVCPAGTDSQIKPGVQQPRSCCTAYLEFLLVKGYSTVVQSGFPPNDSTKPCLRSTILPPLTVMHLFRAFDAAQERARRRGSFRGLRRNCQCGHGRSGGYWTGRVHAPSMRKNPRHRRARMRTGVTLDTLVPF